MTIRILYLGVSFQYINKDKEINNTHDWSTINTNDSRYRLFTKTYVYSKLFNIDNCNDLPDIIHISGNEDERITSYHVNLMEKFKPDILITTPDNVIFNFTKYKPSLLILVNDESISYNDDKIEPQFSDILDYSLEKIIKLYRDYFQLKVKTIKDCENNFNKYGYGIEYTYPIIVKRIILEFILQYSDVDPKIELLTVIGNLQLQIDELKNRIKDM